MNNKILVGIGILGIICVVLMSGCITEKETKYVCSDGTTVSDSSMCPKQEQQKEEITCNKSYIKVGNECCLDKNDNDLCDKDEQTTKTEDTTTETKTDEGEELKKNVVKALNNAENYSYDYEYVTKIDQICLKGEIGKECYGKTDIEDAGIPTEIKENGNGECNVKNNKCRENGNDDFLGARELVYIKETVYEKSEGEWIKTVYKEEPPSGIEMIMVATFELLGEEKINGEDCKVVNVKFNQKHKIQKLDFIEYVIRYNQWEKNAEGEIEMEIISAKMWVSEKTFLPVKGYSEADYQYVTRDKGEEETISCTMSCTISRYDYNKPVKIEIPREVANVH